ncbi:hypothetical protein [Algoriphagus pacificus]|uniref:RiboL-PSP-HEPN domain-containing protein n=1 Tax=Algoriphagus pacificus TaxID=2811234 RepID=A0ABS3CG05_9BACT|nr:hypothetical protein [Algoriphagus pacificus]MBN7816028.1 hypothetical protein [Algoriphagus pacificus]
MEENKKPFRFSKEDAQRLWELADPERLISGSFSNIDTFSFLEIVDNSIKRINNSENPRVIILETWLILDYTIRELLRRGLDIKRFCDDSFDPLPNGFRDCSNLLENFINKQNSKKKNPYLIFSEVQIPIGLRDLIYSKQKVLKEILEFQFEFCNKNNISALTIKNREDVKFQNVDTFWLNSVKMLDSNWFKDANKINKVRNQAAHSINEEKIYIILGIKGEKKLEALKRYCNHSLKQLIGLK